MKIGTTVNHLVAQVTLSKKDIQAVQQTLAAKLPSAPTTVHCNCLPDGCKEAIDEER